MKQNEKNGRAVRWIGGFKLVKGILLLVTAAGLLSLLHKDQAAAISNVVQRMSVDPHARYFRAFVEKFMQLSPKLPLISIGTFFYGVLYCGEGVGLLKRKHWAEYLTVITTASFLPLEIYEMVHQATVTKGIVIALNFAIVLYLVWRLWHSRESQRELHSSPAAR